jgi:tripartite-type tricarboxylate transporter receptor subunit TctC
MRALSILGGLIGAALAASSAMGQVVNGPVTLIVPYPPGGAGTDNAARIVADKLKDQLGQPVIVENRPGAGTVIATDFVKRAAPDGRTLLLTTATFVVSPAVVNTPYDPVKDFTPISLFATPVVVIFANAKVPAKNIREMVALAKQQPGKLTYGSSGDGTSNHLGFELVKAKTGIDLLHVPYNGLAPSTRAVVAGEVDFGIDAIGSLKQHEDAGSIRILAVTNPKRSPTLPNLPAVAEDIPGYATAPWTGILGPAGMKPETVTGLSNAMQAVMKDPGVVERFTKVNWDVNNIGHKEFAEIVKADAAAWAEMAKLAKIEKKPVQ